jgi:hypothetical protein
MNDTPLARMSAAGIDREPAFPMYAQIVYDIAVCPVPKDYEPGRIIITGHLDVGEVILDEFIDQYVGPNDIVRVPLYVGTCANGGIGTRDKARSYSANLRAMDRLAGRCKGVIIGNAHTELTFKHHYLRGKSSIAAAEFIQETSNLAKEHGGHKVWYGLVDFDAAIDCYYGNSVARNTVNDCGDALVTFCGYTMFGGHIPEEEAHTDGYNVVPISTQKQWLPSSECDPWPVLSAYIAGANEWVTGVGFEEGLMHNNDIILQAHGFRFGTMGTF